MHVGTHIITNQPVSISASDRRRHLVIFGQTGTGKSTLIKNMIAQVLETEGLEFFDPHGQEAEEIIDLIPERRIRDVVYVDPSDQEKTIAWNLFPTIAPHLRG